MLPCEAEGSGKYPMYGTSHLGSCISHILRCSHLWVSQGWNISFKRRDYQSWMIGRCSGAVKLVGEGLYDVFPRYSVNLLCSHAPNAMEAFVSWWWHSNDQTFLCGLVLKTASASKLGTTDRVFFASTLGHLSQTLKQNVTAKKTEDMCISKTKITRRGLWW